MRTALLCWLALGGPILAGCGDGPPGSEAAAPFQKAVEEYLSAKSMGMKVEGFESLDVEDDAASADVRMALKDDVYSGLKPVWRITFKKRDGAWQVTAVKR
jgi:hypothetical protein